MVKKKSLITWSIIFLVFLFIGYCTYRSTISTTDSSAGGSSEYFRGGHWHAQLEIVICGQQKDLPRILPGQHHRGSSALHTHDDNKMHMEVANQIVKKSDLSVGKFMDAVGMKFSATEIMGKKNGDVCLNSTTPGSVKMFVNGQPNAQLRDYVPNLVSDTAIDKIKIEFS